ncbi:uncharacterized protein LOC130139091 [Syzygium oleosum]|uniref:uncharacterized protein LOC130139091 n=1 Tax=Syzygium oleosum TaxID=219896 RepID=UPI0024B9DC64|nr:uncharacterized protein LOC130139091 [Syzygium oleosum]
MDDQECDIGSSLFGTVSCVDELMTGFVTLAGNWRPAVPSWEKEFCKLVGSIPWKKLVEAKQYIHIYGKVLTWNDSAVKEAFHNAKERFWAEINGLPCNISLPDPNIHIDEVDWESETDPELLLDLEQGPEAFHGSNSGQTVFFGDVLANPSFECGGCELKSSQDIVCDNWDTWDWGDQNRDLEPAGPDVA